MLGIEHSELAHKREADSLDTYIWFGIVKMAPPNHTTTPISFPLILRSHELVMSHWFVSDYERTNNQLVAEREMFTKMALLLLTHDGTIRCGLCNPPNQILYLDQHLSCTRRSFFLPTTEEAESIGSPYSTI
jgi:hypothetical protein